jgi:hypothetical protein
VLALNPQEGKFSGQFLVKSNFELEKSLAEREVMEHSLPWARHNDILI